MSGMVDKVARAIYLQRVKEGDWHPTVDEEVKDICRRQARAGIESLRIPTPAMLEAGCASHPARGYNSETSLKEIIEAEFTAMINEALK